MGSNPSTTSNNLYMKILTVKEIIEKPNNMYVRVEEEGEFRFENGLVTNPKFDASKDIFEWTNGDRDTYILTDVSLDTEIRNLPMRFHDDIKVTVWID